MQRYCYKNKELLKKQGIVYDLMPFDYPRIARYRNAHFLCAEVRREDNSVIPGAKEKRMKEGFEILAGILEEGYSILLTDERMWNYIYTDAYKTLKEVSDFAKEHGAQVKVIMYLRPQDAWIVSLYHQHILEGLSNQDWDEFINNLPEDTMMLDYAGQCDNIAKVVGKENMIVRVYARELFPNGRIETDFMDAMGVTDLTGMQDLEAENNPSLTNNYAEILRVINLLKKENGLRLSDRQFEQAALDCSLKFGKENKTSLLSPEHRRFLQDRFGEGNDLVNENYVQKGSLKLTVSSDLPVWNRENEQTYRDTVLLLANIDSKQQEQIQKQQEQILLLKKQVREMESDLARIRQMVVALKKVKRAFTPKSKK